MLTEFLYQDPLVESLELSIYFTTSLQRKTSIPTPNTLTNKRFPPQSEILTPSYIWSQLVKINKQETLIWKSTGENESC